MKKRNLIDNIRRVPMSDIRKTYFIRLIGRIAILFLCVILGILCPGEFEILRGMNFFHKFSVLHLLWALWMLDMLYQIIPVKKKIALGSQKLFRHRFKPIRDRINSADLKKYIVSTTKSAYKVMLIWIALGICIGLLYFADALTSKNLFMITTLFYVCDLICVLIWCPFRLLMKNKCCTTCRIFNWDHLMMFTPMIFISGFYSWSLFLMALIVWVIWELCVLLYPERFWEMTNDALKCSNCKDKLCTQYCQKLR